jgi:hypothetical protein
MVMGRIVDYYNVAYVKEHDPSLVQTYLQRDESGNPIAFDEDAIKALDERVGNAQKQRASQQLGTKETEELAKEEKAKEVIDAAKREGFSQAFRWVATYLTLPLIFVFAAIAFVDRWRGGYKQVHIDEAMEKEATPF